MAYTLSLATIEREIKDWLSGIADAVYVNNAPQAVPEPQRSYIVASVGSSVQINVPFKSGNCYVYVFVKNKESGVQDSVEIDRIVNAILAKVPLVTQNIELTVPRLNLGTRSGAYTRSIIRFRLLIKS